MDVLNGIKDCSLSDGEYLTQMLPFKVNHWKLLRITENHLNPHWEVFFKVSFGSWWTKGGFSSDGCPPRKEKSFLPPSGPSTEWTPAQSGSWCSLCGVEEVGWEWGGLLQTPPPTSRQREPVLRALRSAVFPGRARSWDAWKLPGQQRRVLEEETSCGIVLASRRVPQRCAACMKVARTPLLWTDCPWVSCVWRDGPAWPHCSRRACAHSPGIRSPSHIHRRPSRDAAWWCREKDASGTRVLGHLRFVSEHQKRKGCTQGILFFFFFLREFLTRTVDLLYCTWALPLRRSTQPCHFHPQLLLHPSLHRYDLWPLHSSP